MADNIIGDDYAITIRIGNDAITGAAPSFGGAVSLAGVFDRVRLRAQVQKSNVKGGGDTDVKNRIHSRSRMMTIEGFVPGDYVYGPDNIGHYIEVSFQPHSSLAVARGPYVGIIENWDGEARNGGDPQKETIEIDLNPSVPGA
jgi:hypothetical protein